MRDVVKSVQGKMAFARPAKPWSIVNPRSFGMRRTILVETTLAPVTKYHLILVLVAATVLAWAVVSRLPSGGADPSYLIK